jgi:ferredoxin
MVVIVASTRAGRGIPEGKDIMKKALNKIQAHAYVKAAQITAPGHYDISECRGCGVAIKSCKSGLCKDCNRKDRQSWRGERVPIEHQAFLIREHRAGRI